MAARAHRVSDRAGAEKVPRMLPLTGPDTPPCTAATAREFSEHGYVPRGLSDAGDRLFGAR